MLAHQMDGGDGAAAAEATRQQCTDRRNGDDRPTDAVSWLADMTPEAINVMPEAYVGSGSVLMSIDNDT